MSTTIYDNYHKYFVKTSVQSKLISEDNFTYINFFRYMLPVINKINPKRILDIGSGAGTLSLLLASQGHKVVGIDFSGEAIKKSIQSAKYLNLQTKVDFRNYDFLDYISNEQFDLILCLEVIEHILDEKKFLKKIRKMLARNGLIILSTPLDSAPLAKLGLVTSFDEKVGHLRRYSKTKFISLLSSNDLRIEKIIETEGVLRNSLFVFPALGFMVRFIRGPLVRIFTLIDDVIGKILGFSDLVLIATKK